MVYKKLLAVQQKLKAPKNQYNEFGNFYYRSCEDILESLKPLLQDQNATILLNDEIVLVGDRHYVKATAVFIDAETGDKIEVAAYAREEGVRPKMSEPQLTGTASSYARKYALNGLFAIDDQKDADTMDNSRTDDIRQLRKVVKSLAEEKGWSVQVLNAGCKKYYDKPSVGMLNESELQGMIDKINSA